MARPVDKPTTALTKLLYNHGVNASELVDRGYFKNKSSIYGATKRDVRTMKVPILMNIGKRLNMKPGLVLDKLIELQEQYPPKQMYKSQK